jgi:hypothetical protein
VNSTLQFEVTFVDVEPLNPLFSKCKIYVCYHGENRNGSIISKEVIEKAIPTIYNIPIVGRFSEDINDFTDHGGKIEITGNGANKEIRYVHTTKPYGVVPESAIVDWETIGDKEYLTIDGALLWTGRYPEAQEVIESGKPQSMEIDVIEGRLRRDKKFEVTEMVFSALCILGDDVEPCFEDAQIVGYSLNKDSFFKEFQEMYQALREYNLVKGGSDVDKATFADDSKKHIDIDNSKEAAVMEGSWGSVDKSKLRDELVNASNASELVKEAYLIVDEGWEDHPSEALHYPHHVVKDGKLVVHKQGVIAAYARLMQNDPNNEKAKRHIEKHYKELGLDMDNFSLNTSEFALTSEQLEDELKRILTVQEIVEDEWGFEYPKYAFVDYMPEEGIVVAYDWENCYLIGFNYTVQGDLVTVDFDSAKRFKVQYVPMDINNAPDGDEAVNNAFDGDEFALAVKEHVNRIAKFMKAKFEKVEENASTDIETNTETPEKTEQAQEFTQEETQEETTVENGSEVNTPEGEEVDAPKAEEFAELAKNYTELKEAHEALLAELEELREFKANVEKAEREKAENALFERFSSLLSDEEIAQIREKAHEFTLEELETQLYVLVGKKSTTFSTKHQTKVQKSNNRIPVFNDEAHVGSSKPYASLITRFANET